MKYLSLIMVVILFACNSKTEEKKEKTDDKDSLENNDSHTVDVKEAEENPEETSIEEFEKAEGGMSFCDCVKKIDELDKLMMSDNVSDADFENAMAEKEKLVDGDCKVIKMGGQDSPEERAERQRKAKACLTN